MNNFKSSLSIMLATGVLVANAGAFADDGVKVEGTLDSGNYCHEKIPAMRTRTLSNNEPQLKDSSTGDVVDYYGPCDESPTGKDQIRAQKLDEQHHMEGSKGGDIGRF